MADRERSRSRSPEGGAPPEDANQNGDDHGAPSAGDAPHAEAPAAGDAPAGDDAGDEVKLYVGNLDYGTCCLIWTCMSGSL